MSILDFLSPKRAAATSIAKDILSHRNDETDTRQRLDELRHKNEGLYKMVIEELGKYGYRVPGDS